jgi:peptidoglycan hydrolase-like protein with peptidoglycan-binding domain
MNKQADGGVKNPLSMKRTLIAVVLAFFAFSSLALADPAVASAQQKLKDEGFYYGEINGEKDADTIAAIRRYQIRHGLQITGELNGETQHALGLASKPATSPAPPAAHTPGPTPPGYREETPAPPTAPVPPAANPQITNEDELDDEEVPAPPSSPQFERANPFSGTPYENAPPPMQQNVVSRAQLILGRMGYYREEIDGVYGPGLNFALRNYQARLGLEPSGRLDVETLASLNLLPEQRTTQRRMHRRFFAPPVRMLPERIYIPR